MAARPAELEDPGGQVVISSAPPVFSPSSPFLEPFTLQLSEVCPWCPTWSTEFCPLPFLELLFVPNRPVLYLLCTEMALTPCRHSSGAPSTSRLPSVIAAAYSVLFLLRDHWTLTRSPQFKVSTFFLPGIWSLVVVPLMVPGPCLPGESKICQQSIQPAPARDAHMNS